MHNLKFYRLLALVRKIGPPVLAGFLVIVVWGKLPAFAATVGTQDDPALGFRLIPEAAAVGDVAVMEIDIRHPGSCRLAASSSGFTTLSSRFLSIRAKAETF